MNQRIRELAEQAESYAKAEYEKWTPTADYSGVPSIRDIYNEKFAELIVRECMEQLNISNVPTSISAGLNLGRVAIKEHFGVEE